MVKKTKNYEWILKHTGEPFNKFITKFTGLTGKREEWFVWNKKDYPLHFVVDKRSFVEKNWLSILAVIISVTIGALGIILTLKKY